LFIDVFGLNNPDVSIYSTPFSFAFLNITGTTGNAIGSISQNLSYTVSSAPTNLQINNVTIQNKNYNVMTNYTLVASSVGTSTIAVNNKSQIGVEIKFPDVYSLIWSITEQPLQINLTLGTTLFSSSDIYMVEGKLMAKYNITNYQSFSQVKVNFNFRNPNVDINCNSSTFVISLFDFKQNSILAETVGNNAACLTLSGTLYSIKISGNSLITAGNVSTYSIQLDKPAKYLLITPKTTTSAISFSPSQILFQNYSSSLQSFNITSSPAFSGNFVIQFGKT
jgi:hypothetical protein